MKLAHVRWGDEEAKNVILFIHGHTSSKDTWKGLLREFLNYDCYAVDLRGHGESEMAIDDNYSFEAVTSDIKLFVEENIFSNEEKSIIIIGHSMGSRVAVAYAAIYPERVIAIVIEDMQFGASMVYLEASEEKKEKMKKFERFQINLESLKNEMQEFGFDNARVQKWLTSGRIIQKDDGYWSGVHPWSSYLSWNQMLTTTCTDYFQTIARNQLPTILFIADAYSAITEEGLTFMKSTYPSLKFRNFPGSDHSIHNTAKLAFIDAVKEFLGSLSLP